MKNLVKEAWNWIKGFVINGKQGVYIEVDGKMKFIGYADSVEYSCGFDDRK